MHENIKVPFKVGKPVEYEYFIKRENELRKLTDQIKYSNIK